MRKGRHISRAKFLNVRVRVGEIIKCISPFFSFSLLGAGGWGFPELILRLNLISSAEGTNCGYMP